MHNTVSCHTCIDNCSNGYCLKVGREWDNSGLGLLRRFFLKLSKGKTNILKQQLITIWHTYFIQVSICICDWGIEWKQVQKKRAAMQPLILVYMQMKTLINRFVLGWFVL